MNANINKINANLEMLSKRVDALYEEEWNEDEFQDETIAGQSGVGERHDNHSDDENVPLSDNILAGMSKSLKSPMLQMFL